MPYYEPFGKSADSFRERKGSPTEFDAALGILLIDFQELEAIIRVAIAAELKTDPDVSSIVTAELPFRKLVHVLSALIRHRHSTGSEHVIDELARWEELAGKCFFIEEARNRLIHSFYPAPHAAGSSALRVKRMVRKDGLKEHREPVLATDLLDLADYMAYLMTEIENLLDLSFGAADTT